VSRQIWTSSSQRASRQPKRRSFAEPWKGGLIRSGSNAHMRRCGEPRGNANRGGKIPIPRGIILFPPQWEFWRSLRSIQRHRAPLPIAITPSKIAMKAKFTALLGATIIASLTACASNPNSPLAEGAMPPTPAPAGYLLVFTATQRVEVDFNAYFDPHTGYDIDDASGKLFKFVPNHGSNIDEAPDPVNLPPGNYTIVARSAGGMVRFSVGIRSGEITRVYLDGGGSDRPPTPQHGPSFFPTEKSSAGAIPSEGWGGERRGTAFRGILASQIPCCGRTPRQRACLPGARSR
jgi:hypothetical protein